MLHSIKRKFSHFSSGASSSLSSLSFTKHTIAVGIKPRENGRPGPPGPWQASVRPNVQLQRLQEIRKAEEKESRLQHPKRMKERLAEKQRKEMNQACQQQKRSQYVRETILQGEKEKARRTEEKQQEAYRAEQKLLLQSKSTAKKFKDNITR